ncbi:universal stress protein [Halobellus sp. EA9]|uniref:universal stress protein n=1 Tax=Halobellus sp. EA9 TaxID=3421647 RepID=UPI003EC08B39
MAQTDEIESGSPSKPERPASGPAPPVLLLIPDEGPLDGPATVAYALAADECGEVLATRVVSVPEQTPLSLAAEKRESLRASVSEAIDAMSTNERTTPARGLVRIGRTWSRIVAETATDHDVTTIVTSPPRDRRSASLFRRSAIDRLQARTDCRLVVTNASSGFTDASSILVPVAGGPHSEAALDVARALGVSLDAWIDVLHVVEPETQNEPDPAQPYFEAAADQLDGYREWDSWKLEAEDVGETIAEQSTYYDATILGAPRRSYLKQLVFGSTTTDVRANADGAILTVRSRR